MAREIGLKLDVSLLPSDFSPSIRRPALRPSLRQARRASPDSKGTSPQLRTQSRTISRLSRSPVASYRPVYIRTYRYRQQVLTPKIQKPERTAKVFKCYWATLPYQEGRPEVREGACMTECCGSLYLYGGLSKNVHSDIYVLKQNWDTWELAVVSGPDSEPRYGHSMLEHGTELLIFGGAANSNSKTQIRECFNTVRVLQPTSGFGVTWDNLMTKGEIVSMRRYHAAAVVGRHLMVIGGVNQRNKVLDDVALLDLSTEEWSMQTFTTGPLAIACHTAAAVFESHVQIKGIDDPILLQDSSELQTRGVYIFGGMDSLCQCNNTLRIVRPSTDGLSCCQLQVTGKPPAARCQHSMVFSRFHNVLVIFGGKSPETQSEAATVFKDLHILDLRSLHWSQVLIAGHLPKARWAHCAGTLQDKVVVFGGIEVNQFCTSETFLLSLSSQCESPALPVVLASVSYRSKSAGRVKVRQRTYLM